MYKLKNLDILYFFPLIRKNFSFQTVFKPKSLLIAIRLQCYVAKKDVKRNKNAMETFYPVYQCIFSQLKTLFLFLQDIFISEEYFVFTRYSFILRYIFFLQDILIF